MKDTKFNIIEKALIGNVITMVVKELDQVFDEKQPYNLEVKMPRIRGLITTFEDIVRNAQSDFDKE